MRMFFKLILLFWRLGCECCWAEIQSQIRLRTFRCRWENIFYWYIILMSIGTFKPSYKGKILRMHQIPILTFHPLVSFPYLYCFSWVYTVQYTCTGRLVKLAASWQQAPAQHICETRVESPNQVTAYSASLQSELLSLCMDINQPIRWRLTSVQSEFLKLCTGNKSSNQVTGYNYPANQARAFCHLILCLETLSEKSSNQVRVQSLHPIRLRKTLSSERWNPPNRCGVLCTVQYHPSKSHRTKISTNQM